MSALTIAELAFDDEGYLYGDGRRKLAPSFSYIRAQGRGYAGCPRPLKVAQAQRAIRTLLDCGNLSHSPLGYTCWVVQDWAQLTGRKVTIAEHWWCGKVVGYTSTLPSD